MMDYLTCCRPLLCDNSWDLFGPFWMHGRLAATSHHTSPGVLGSGTIQTSPSLLHLSVGAEVRGPADEYNMEMQWARETRGSVILFK